MWELRYTAMHLREFIALMIYHRQYNRAKRERITKRMIPIAEIKPTKRVKSESENNSPAVVDLASEDDLPLINFRESSD